jgi:hypothetical protein
LKEICASVAKSIYVTEILKICGERICASVADKSLKPANKKAPNKLEALV